MEHEEFFQSLQFVVRELLPLFLVATACFFISDVQIYSYITIGYISTYLVSENFMMLLSGLYRKRFIYNRVSIITLIYVLFVAVCVHVSSGAYGTFFCIVGFIFRIIRENDIRIIKAGIRGLRRCIQ